MKQRNFEAAPLSEYEFATMLMGVPDDLLTGYLRWIAEELNRRGITISQGLANQLAELADDDNTHAAQ